MNDQYSKRGAIPGELYRKVAQNCLNTIRKHNQDRMVVADGNSVGAEVIPEIFDLDIWQSCRGYFPYYISHYLAPWVFNNPDDAQDVIWPGKIDGKNFNKKNLEDFFAQWIDVVSKGVGVHCGVCGCWNETPHNVFLTWFEDVLNVLTENEIGWGLWEFKGTYGVLNSERKDVDYKD